MEKSVLSILNETTIVVSVVQLKGVSKQAAAAGYRSNRFCQITRKVLRCVVVNLGSTYGVYMRIINRE